MKNNRKSLMALLIVAFVILAACGNSSDKSSASSNNPSSDSSLNQGANKDTDKNTVDNSSEGTKTPQLNDRESTSNETSTNSKDSDSLKPTDHKKDEYLQKLNEMEELDRHSEVGTTMLELEKQEAERYQKWDRELNDIYGILKEQLHAEQMEQLREEQRNWIKHRDEVAEESSLKYKGGSTESLEYVATQASLTRERCYELVAKYMK